MLDGNVLRVLSRLKNECGDIGAAATRARLGDVAAKLLDHKQPGRFNQTLMELGATVCLPRDPKCLLCPVIDFCEARRLGAEGRLPVQPAKRAAVFVEKTLLVARRGGKILLWKRTDGARMKGFYELPEAVQLPGAGVSETLGEFRHSITNHNYRFTVVGALAGRIPRGFRWISPRELERLPLSTTARKALAFFHL